MISRIKKNVKNQSKKVKKEYSNFKKNFIGFFREKGKMKKLKKWLLQLWHFIKKRDVLNVLLLALPFVVMDIATRLFGSSITFFSIFRLTPRIFSLAYIILFLGISLNIRNKEGRIVSTKRILFNNE